MGVHCCPNTNELFQSPCGDLESGDDLVNCIPKLIKRFQSPCGDLESGDLIYRENKNVD